MREYILFNTDKRTKSHNDFEKNFFKLMNNAVFGKTMENLRKRQNIKLMTNENKLNKYITKPGFLNCKIFNENLVAVHSVKEKLVLDKPIYVGFCILDLSKWLMYDFHYGYMKKKYRDSAQLLFTDTDSLCYEIRTEDFYKDMYHNKGYFDLSDMKIEQFKDNENKRVIGKFKDETEGVPIKEFIGLRSKMYSIKLDNDIEKKTAKGIVKCVIKNRLKHEIYRDILESGGKLYSEMKIIRSEKHQLYTMSLSKISLSAYDDKRYISHDGIQSYAYGHYKITRESE